MPPCLVEEDDARRRRPRLSEDVADRALAVAHVLGEELRALSLQPDMAVSIHRGSFL